MAVRLEWLIGYMWCFECNAGEKDLFNVAASIL